MPFDLERGARHFADDPGYAEIFPDRADEDAEPKPGWDPKKKGSTSNERERLIALGLIKPAPEGPVPQQIDYSARRRRRRDRSRSTIGDLYGYGAE